MKLIENLIDFKIEISEIRKFLLVQLGSDIINFWNFDNHKSEKMCLTENLKLLQTFCFESNKTIFAIQYSVWLSHQFDYLDCHIPNGKK